MSKQAFVRFVTQSKNEPVAGEQQRPEQERAFLSRPEGREFIWQRQIAVAVMKNVSNREIVAKCGRYQDDRSKKHRAEAGDASAPGSLAKSLRSRLPSN